MSVKVYDNGVSAREDKFLGTLVYSPYTGLMHAVHPSLHDVLGRWLDGNNIKANHPVRAIAKNIKALTSHKFSKPHFIPDVETWNSTTHCEFPIVINWLITGNCSLKCKYCFANDVIEMSEEESEKTLIKTGERILSKNPLAVVITGGDPLSSPYFATAIDVLFGRTGLLVDTNGAGLNKSTAKIIKKSNASVRLSIDSATPSINNRLRQGKNNKHDALNVALHALQLCLNSGIPVTVQTVVTNNNMSGLSDLGDRLFRMGVKSWRVFGVCQFGDDSEYEKISPTEKNYRHYFEDLEQRMKSSGACAGKMALQTVNHIRSDSVVLVTPGGNFMIQPKSGRHKVPIDEKKPNNPTAGKIMESIDVAGHVQRYLNFC